MQTRQLDFFLGHKSIEDNYIEQKFKSLITSNKKFLLFLVLFLQVDLVLDLVQNAALAWSFGFILIGGLFHFTVA